MNLACIIERKKTYLDLYIDSIETDYRTAEMGSVGSPYIIVHPSPPVFTIHCTVDDLNQFEEVVQIGKRTTCRCIFETMQAEKDYLIEFVPTEIQYFGRFEVAISSSKYTLIEV